MSDKQDEKKLPEIKLRSNLIKHKSFLSELMSAKPKQTRHLLNFASQPELKTLIKVLGFMVQGKIKISKKTFQFIVKKKKLKLLKQLFESKELLKKFLASSRKEQLLKLYQLNLCFKPMLQNLSASQNA